MLHCDGHNGKGGENLFVDGFRAAEQLREDYKEAFEFLSATHVPSRYYVSILDCLQMYSEIRSYQVKPSKTALVNKPPNMRSLLTYKVRTFLYRVLVALQVVLLHLLYSVCPRRNAL